MDGQQLGKEKELEAYIDTMVLVAAADGAVDKPELAIIREVLKKIPGYAGLSEDERDELVKGAIRRVMKDGLEFSVIRVSNDLQTESARWTAFELGIVVARADGKLARGETENLRRLVTAFGLPVEQAKAELLSQRDDDI